MRLVKKVWREGRPSSAPGKEPQRGMAAKDEYPQCRPWETQKVEENTAFFNAVFNHKTQKDELQGCSWGKRRCNAWLGLEVPAGETC